MTPYQQRFVDSIIATSKIDKDYANWAIKDFAQRDPYQLWDLKRLVVEELKRRG